MHILLNKCTLLTAAGKLQTTSVVVELSISQSFPPTVTTAEELNPLPVIVSGMPPKNRKKKQLLIHD